MKEKLLFVIDSLHIGGAERSLITLLRHLDYDRFEVDLQLFDYDGALMSMIPSNVTILPQSFPLTILKKPLTKNLKYPGLFYNRTGYSLIRRIRKLSSSDLTCLYWKKFGRYFKRIEKEYDFAIAYSQGMPTFYVIEKVSAQRKIVRITALNAFSERYTDYQIRFYNKADKITVVSDKVKDYYAKSYLSHLRDKIKVLPDLIDSGLIEKSSHESISVEYAGLILLTVARLDKDTKGYDIAIETAKYLKQRQVKFRWYAIGEGHSHREIERLISENDLKDDFILLGSKINPYPFIAKCDIYVQPSRHEGNCIALIEAMALNKPVVATDFSTARAHIQDGITGFISSFAPQEIADLIQNLSEDKSKYSMVVENLAKRRKGNLEEIEKFYDLLEN